MPAHACFFFFCLYHCSLLKVVVKMQGMRLKNSRINLDSGLYHFTRGQSRPASDANRNASGEWAKRRNVNAWLDKENCHIPDKSEKERHRAPCQSIRSRLDLGHLCHCQAVQWTYYPQDTLPTIVSCNRSNRSGRTSRAR